MGEVDCTTHGMWHEPLPRTVEWMRCSGCAHVHTRHYWTDAGLAEVFARSNAGQIAGANLERKVHVWKPVVANVVGLLGGYAKLLGGAGITPAWLDVGFGDGSLLITAEEFGFEGYGIDRREQAVAALSGLSARVARADFMQVRLQPSPRVISMMDVLEHMPFPRLALQHAREIIAPEGCLVVSMPNMQGGIWRILDETAENPYWGELEHHHNFTRTRLSRLLADHGFAVALFDIPDRYRAQMELYAVPKR